MGFFSKLFGKKPKPVPVNIEEKSEVEVKPLVEPKSSPVAVPTPQPVAQQKVHEEPTPVAVPTPQPVAQPLVQEEPAPRVEAPAPKAVAEPVVEAQPSTQPEPQPVAPESKQETIPAQNPEPVVETKVEPVTAKPRYAGKYEVFPEAGLFKYRLKASNGEILIVSNGYTTRNGAISGIDTLKKNVEAGKFELITDKNSFSQFRLFTQNGSRQIAAGEFYETMKRAESAMESVKKFAGTEKIVDLDELPAAEIREEVVTIKPIDKNQNGKYEIGNSEGQWTAMLKASNGEVLFVTSGYASKSGLMNGIESVKKAIAAENFRVSKDKQGRFQFKVYSPINQLILVGETYGSKEACFSALDSARRFAQDAKIIE